MSLPGLGPGRVLVLWARPVDRPALLGLLDDQERDRHDRLRRAADRARFGTAHALARIAVGEQLGRAPQAVRFSRRCPWCGGPHGKPQLDPPELALSLSHSGDRVVVALRCDGPVGVDVEQLAALPDVELLARQALSRTERAAVQQPPAGDRGRLVLTCWTRKEAALKATGHGLAACLTDLEVSPPTAPARVLRWTGASAPGCGAHLRDLDAGPGHVGALAVLGGPEPELVERVADDLLLAG